MRRAPTRFAAAVLAALALALPACGRGGEVPIEPPPPPGVGFEPPGEEPLNPGEAPPEDDLPVQHDSDQATVELGED